jgi:hypothetical protein
MKWPLPGAAALDRWMSFTPGESLASILERLKSILPPDQALGELQSMLWCNWIQIRPKLPDGHELEPDEICGLVIVTSDGRRFDGRHVVALPHGLAMPQSRQLFYALRNEEPGLTHLAPAPATPPPSTEALTAMASSQPAGLDAETRAIQWLVPKLNKRTKREGYMEECREKFGISERAYLRRVWPSAHIAAGLGKAKPGLKPGK